MDVVHFTCEPKREMDKINKSNAGEEKGVKRLKMNKT